MGHTAQQQYSRCQQGCADRSTNKWLGDIHSVQGSARAPACWRWRPRHRELLRAISTRKGKYVSPRAAKPARVARALPRELVALLNAHSKSKAIIFTAYSRELRLGFVFQSCRRP